MAKIYWFCSVEQFNPETLVEHAVAAEAAGFDGIMISEHFHPWVDDDGTSSFAFSVLGAIAAKTTKIHLMTAVTAPLFRFHPGIAAQAAATIDRLSGGRFELGLGSGENINEAPLGFPLPPYKERSMRLREAITIISGLQKGTSLSFNGEFYQTKSAKLYSPPMHHIPTYLAAGGPQTATLAGEMCDGVIVSVKEVDTIIKQVIEPARKAHGSQKLTVVASRWSVFAQDEAEQWEVLRPQRGLRAPSRGTATHPRQLQDEADQLSRSEVLKNYHHVKNADDYIATYAPLITDLQADIVGIQTASGNQLRTINMLGREVLPKLRQL